MPNAVFWCFTHASASIVESAGQLAASS